MRTLLTIGVFTRAMTAATAAAPPAQPRVIAIAGGDNLAFSMPAITAKPGESLRVVVSTKSMQPKATMAHNFVLLAPGTDPSAFAMMAAMSKATEYIPAGLKAKILVSTRMAGSGETVSADFKAPVKPGQYTYICSFPGHLSAGMRGVLTVR
jgi:azurin